MRRLWVYHFSLEVHQMLMYPRIKSRCIFVIWKRDGICIVNVGGRSNLYDIVQKSFAIVLKYTSNFVFIVFYSGSVLDNFTYSLLTYFSGIGVVVKLHWSNPAPKLLKPWSLFNWHGLTVIQARISNYVHYKVWRGITHPFPNFNSIVFEETHGLTILQKHDGNSRQCIVWNGSCFCKMVPKGNTQG